MPLVVLLVVPRVVPRVVLGFVPLLVLLSVLSLAATSTAAAQPAATVELDYRMRPDQDHLSEAVVEAVTTLRVREDRGIVARSQGRLSTQPTVVRLTTRRAMRLRSGPAQGDGSFQSELRFLAQSHTVKGADGQVQVVPDRMSFDGVVARATLDRDGGLRDGSLAVEGGDPAVGDVLRATFEAVLRQAVTLPVVTLTPGQSVPQDVAMQVPVPGVGQLDLKMRIMNRLLGVDEGIARVEQIYTMEFGTPSGAIRIAAEGSGGGTIRYEIATRRLLSSESGTLMKFVIDGPDGILEMQMDSRETQQIRPTPAALR